MDQKGDDTMRAYNMTVITDSFPDGHRSVAVAIEYDRVLDDRQISPEAFRVTGRIIIGLYTNNEAGIREEGIPGKYLILTLDPDAPEYAGKVFMPANPNRTPRKPPEEETEPPDPGQPKLDENGNPISRRNSKKRTPLPEVQQILDIAGADGTVLPRWETAAVCTGERHLLAKEFQVFTYEGMKYNLFIPRDYDPQVRYPMVLFIPDAGGISDDPLLTLTQGNGAIAWMTPEAQAETPCFVLGPQYAGDVSLTSDRFEVRPELETIKRICDHVVDCYSIDPDRLYATGQSMGCMSSCELNIRYPDYFAASLLVAGQWDPKRMAGLTGQNLWICVARTDFKAFPGMNAVVDAMEAAGGRFGRYTWDGKSTPEQFNALADAAMAEDVHLRYTVFWDVVEESGESRRVRGYMGHAGTWPVVYGIDRLRAWLFTNVRPGSSRVC